MGKDAKWKLYRPGKITAIAIILIIIGVLGIIAVSIVETRIALEYNTNNIFIPVSFTPPLSNQGTLIELVLIDLVSILTNQLYYIAEINSQILIINQSIINSIQLVVLGGLIFSGLAVTAGVGLLYMKKWAYYLAVLLYLLVLIGLIILRIFI